MAERTIVAIFILLVFTLPFLAVGIDSLFFGSVSRRRFGLRTLVIAITVACLLLGFLVYEARK